MAKKKGGPKTGKKSKHRFSFKEKAAAPEKPSPFAIRSGKLKFDILGRKVKGDFVGTFEKPHMNIGLRK